jgi:hypothetical protein
MSLRPGWIPYGLYDTESNKSGSVNYNEGSITAPNVENGLHLKYTTADYLLDPISLPNTLTASRELTRILRGRPLLCHFSHSSKCSGDQSRSLNETPYNGRQAVWFL